MRTRFSFSALGSRTCPKAITKVTPVHSENEQHTFVKSVKLYWRLYDNDVGSVKHIVSLGFQLRFTVEVIFQTFLSLLQHVSKVHILSWVLYLWRISGFALSPSWMPELLIPSLSPDSLQKKLILILLVTTHSLWSQMRVGMQISSLAFTLSSFFSTTDQATKLDAHWLLVVPQNSVHQKL